MFAADNNALFLLLPEGALDLPVGILFGHAVTLVVQLFALA